MPAFFVKNFGCRASQADGAAIEAQLSDSGYVAANDTASADLIVLNTCTVTATADTEIQHTVRRLHTANPDTRIVITGCYAQRAPTELAKLPGVFLVIGNSDKERIAQHIAEPYHSQVRVSDMANTREFTWAPASAPLTDRARPNLKIQDGCSNRCTFCIIPSVRGNSRSAPLPLVVAHATELGKTYPEVVLTGINLGRWGREAGMQMRLSDLMRTLLEKTEVARFRLSSVEPMDWSDSLLELVASTGRIAQHVHAPLQSGSASVLRRMRRKYRPEHYADRILRARKLMPDAAIGADVMVGFPGETEQEFAETCELVERLPLTYLHVFPYSERPDTPAAEYSEQIPWQLRKERARFLTQLGIAKNKTFRQSMVGKTLSAVTLLNGTAMTTNYLSVELSSQRPSMAMIELRIGGITANGLREQALFPILF